MRLDGRTLLVGALATAVGLAVLDPVGLVDAVEGWLAVASPADGSVAEIAASARARGTRVRGLARELDRDPLLSGALLAAGVGAGIVLGSVGGYLHQRTLLRRGEGDA